MTHDDEISTTPLFSIIVPVYNAGSFLRSCLFSLRGQEFTDFEVICLDDSSTDSSFEEYNNAAAGDNRFQWINSSAHIGVSAQRNRGIEFASGKYVLFVDADDYISPHALQAVHKTITEKDPDIVVFGGETFPDETWANLDLTTSHATYQDNGIKALFGQMGSRPFTWNKAYRSSMLKDHGCQFDPTLCVGEDHAFQFVTFPYAHTICFIPDKLYFYRQNNPYSAATPITKEDQTRLKEHVRFVSSIMTEWDLRGFLTSQTSCNTLGNWIIEYLYEDLIANAQDSLPEFAETIVKWYKEGALTHAGLTPTNTQGLKCLESIAESKNSRPSISIIMPIYNVEDYLETALYSLRRQTMAHFEVIMVDDGSDDNTIEIADRFCRLDKRFHLIKQHHQFAGAARNSGMDIAIGEYLLFLDGDDYFEYDLLEKSLDRIKKYDADICAFRARRYDQSRGETVGMEWSCDCDLVPRDKTFSHTSCPDNIFCFTIPSPWSKLFRANFVKEHGLRFQVIRSANDASFVLAALAAAEKIVTLDETLLTYRVNLKTSLQATQEKDPFSFFDALLHIREELIRLDVYKDVKRAYINFALDFCLYNLGTLKTASSFRELYEFLKTNGFAELELKNKSEQDFYVYTGKNYERMKYMLKHTPRSYQLAYPEFNNAPLLPQSEIYNKIDAALKPIKQRMPSGLRNVLGKAYRYIKNRS